jgi:hypothetical protein
MNFRRFTKFLKFKNRINPRYARCTRMRTHSRPFITLTCGTRAQRGPPVMHIPRDRERGTAWRRRLPPTAEQGRRQGRPGLGPAAAGDGSGLVGRHRGCPARPPALSVWVEVARGLLATAAGGCGRAAPATAVHGGGRGRKTGVSRSARSSGGAVVIDWNRGGMEERIGWRLWSSTRLANGGHGHAQCGGGKKVWAFARKEEKGILRPSRCSITRREEAGRVAERRTRGIHGGDARRMVATSRARVTRWDISANTWCATEQPVWDAVLGQLWWKSGHGPIVKVVHLSILYNFYLNTIVIRPTD